MDKSRQNLDEPNDSLVGQIYTKIIFEILMLDNLRIIHKIIFSPKTYL